jgi:hypothetical protein
MLLVFQVPGNALLQGGVFGHPVGFMPCFIDFHTRIFSSLKIGNGSDFMKNNR